MPEAITGNSLTIDRTFNGYGELDGQTVNVSGNTIVQWTVTRDNSGRIIQKTEAVDGITANYDYSYDLMGRLVTVNKDGALVENYTYDLKRYAHLGNQHFKRHQQSQSQLFRLKTIS